MKPGVAWAAAMARIMIHGPLGTGSVALRAIVSLSAAWRQHHIDSRPGTVPWQPQRWPVAGAITPAMGHCWGRGIAMAIAPRGAEDLEQALDGAC